MGESCVVVKGLRTEGFTLDISRTNPHRENDVTITTTTLFRGAGVAAVLAGLIFIGVQINHPHLDATSITTTDVMTRNSLKMLMAADVPARPVQDENG